MVSMNILKTLTKVFGLPFVHLEGNFLEMVMELGHINNTHENRVRCINVIRHNIPRSHPWRMDILNQWPQVRHQKAKKIETNGQEEANLKSEQAKVRQELKERHSRERKDLELRQKTEEDNLDRIQRNELVTLRMDVQMELDRSENDDMRTRIDRIREKKRHVRNAAKYSKGSERQEAKTKTTKKKKASKKANEKANEKNNEKADWETNENTNWKACEIKTEEAFQIKTEEAFEIKKEITNEASNLENVPVGNGYNKIGLNMSCLAWQMEPVKVKEEMVEVEAKKRSFSQENQADFLLGKKIKVEIE